MLLFLFGILTVPAIVFALPIMYCDNISKDMLKDYNPNRLDLERYME